MSVCRVPIISDISIPSNIMGPPAQSTIYFTQTRSTLFFCCCCCQEWHECAGRAGSIWLRDNTFPKVKKEKFQPNLERESLFVCPSAIWWDGLPSFFAVITYTERERDGPKGNTDCKLQVNIFFSFPLSHGERALLHEKSQKRRWVSSSSRPALFYPPPQGGMCFLLLLRFILFGLHKHHRRAEINSTRENLTGESLSPLFFFHGRLYPLEWLPRKHFSPADFSRPSK